MGFPSRIRGRYIASYNDNSTPVSLQYPIRFSAGVQQETFFNFTGAQNQQFRPYAEITIF